jgi:hypothetical protein
MMLDIAACILIVLGLAHSYLGEKYILIRLFKRTNIPHLYGSDDFTRNTLRFAWHITTFAWLGIAVILAFETAPSNLLLYTTSIVFLVSGLVSVYFSKGKHFSWVCFLAISLLTFFSAS